MEDLTGVPASAGRGEDPDRPLREPAPIDRPRVDEDVAARFSRPVGVTGGFAPGRPGGGATGSGGGSGAEDLLTENELTRLLNEFLRAQDYNTRVIFMRRFWFGDTTKEIAKRLHASESMVKSRVSRTLKRLREYLRKEGYDI